jgi:hypothetical protein
MDESQIETEHAIRWAGAVRKHIDAHAPYGGEVEVLEDGARCRVVLWRNEAKTRAFDRDISARDIAHWGEHFVGELFGLLHKSIFGQGWHVALPKQTPTAKPRRRARVEPEEPAAAIMAPVSIEDAHPTTQLSEPVSIEEITLAFDQFTTSSSWPPEARLEVIDEGTTVAFLVEGDDLHRFRQRVDVSTFMEQQVATVSRFLTRYQERKASNTDIGLG